MFLELTFYKMGTGNWLEMNNFHYLNHRRKEISVAHGKISMALFTAPPLLLRHLEICVAIKKKKQKLI